MIFHITDMVNNILFTNIKPDCHKCISKYLANESIAVICLNGQEERRLGNKLHGDKKIFLCCNTRSAKTSKLFKSKVEILIYSIPSMQIFKNEIEQVIINVEREKYSKIVHNLKTLNAQSLLNQYKFIPQHEFYNNFENLFSYVLNEVKVRPKDAVIALLRQAKNNDYMKTEFSTHEKLSIEDPLLSPLFHEIRKVILNVYHSFNNEFKERRILLKIDDSDIQIKFDYGTVRIAIYHMFSNAVKYMAKDSKLKITISSDDHYAYVTFHMSSLYLFPEEVDKIFQDNFSGKVAVSRELNGSGFGMGLIRKALSLNNASIDIIPGTKKQKISNIDYSDNQFILKFKQHK